MNQYKASAILGTISSIFHLSDRDPTMTKIHACVLTQFRNTFEVNNNKAEQRNILQNEDKSSQQPKTHEGAKDKKVKKIEWKSDSLAHQVWCARAMGSWMAFDDEGIENKNVYINLIFLKILR